MGTPALALFVPFASPGESWVVRRAHTVVESYDTREDAMIGAFGIAADLCARLGTNVRIEVQDAEGGWRALSPVNAHKSARSFASLRKETTPPASRKPVSSGR